MTVTVYTKRLLPTMQPRQSAFDKDGIEYEEAPIDERVLTLARIKGWKAAPLVVSDEHPEYSFSGAQPHQIEDFITKHKEG